MTAVDIRTPLKGLSPVHASQIDSFIWKRNPQAPPVGSAYVLWGRVHGIQAHIAAGQGIWETGWFRTGKATRNPAGIMSGGKLVVYPSWREGIGAHCKLLAQYATPGTWYWKEQIRRTGEAGTLRSMAHVWAPPQLQPTGMHGGDEYAERIAELAQGILDEPEPPKPGTEGHWAKDHVEAAASRGVLIGTPEGWMRPDWSMTRAELAMILYRTMPRPKRPLTEVPLPNDVPPSHWAATAIHEALNYRWMTTDENNNFHPDAPATRQDVAYALAMSEAPRPTWRGTTYFPDLDEQNLAVCMYAYRAGWFSGYPDGYFRPRDPVSRGEIAAVLDRSFGWSRRRIEGIVGATTGEWQEAGWVEKAKLWIAASVAKLYYAVDELMATSFHLEPPEKVQSPPFYAQPWFWMAAAGVGLTGYALSKAR